MYRVLWAYRLFIKNSPNNEDFNDATYNAMKIYFAIVVL